MTNMTNQTENTLTPRQRRAVEQLVDPAFTGGAAGLCSELNIRPAVLRGWFAQPDFRAAIGRAVEQYAESALPDVWRALIKRCLAGELAAIKLYFELRSRVAEKPDGGVIFISGDEKLDD